MCSSKFLRRGDNHQRRGKKIKPTKPAGKPKAKAFIGGYVEDGQYDAFKAAAKSEGRSVTGHLRYLLESGQYKKFLLHGDNHQPKRPVKKLKILSKGDSHLRSPKTKHK